MNNTFITWDKFSQGFGKEMTIAEDVFNLMEKNGLEERCLVKMDFTFISDRKENLVELSEFVSQHYQYTVEDVKKTDGFWELDGRTGAIPITKDNLMYWALDMYKRGFEFDAELDAYGGFTDGDDQIFPDLSTDKAIEYFNLGIQFYNNGDLSGALFNWSLVIDITPDDVDAYYSRAIVKNELYTWKAALRDYDKALELAPDFVSALINRGSLKDENGDYEGAMQDYQKVLQLDNVELENLQEVHFNLGNTNFNMGKKDEACSNWIKAFDLGADYAKENIEKYCL
ncbi:tetratricopeptide repeat protein [Chryseobacterium culicis]|uniref:tetratricopeptide repeat protein n=1 Tax=Chryseobacterium culicis TaxID=680127 RepID=UPI0028A17B89|nr:hypothetical protein [Chryseobacterium culicis]